MPHNVKCCNLFSLNTETILNTVSINQSIKPNYHWSLLDMNYVNSDIWNTTHFFKQFVMSRWTSWRSSNSNIAPKYPMRLSVNRGEAISFRHSNWPKCAGYLNQHLLINQTVKFPIIYKKKSQFQQMHSTWILMKG